MSSTTRDNFGATWIESTRVRRFFDRRVLVGLALLLVAPLSVLYINQTSGLAGAGYDVAVLENEKKLWQMRNEQIRLQITQLESLDRIDRLATSNLNMGPPKHQIYINAPSVRVPMPPVPASSPVPAPRSRLATVFQWVTGRP